MLENIPIPRNLSSNIGLIMPSFVGPTFINKFPPQLTVIANSLTNSDKVKYSDKTAFLRNPQDFLSIVMQFSHLCGRSTPKDLKIQVK